MVRCFCGAASCSGFLGAKSRGFQVGEQIYDVHVPSYFIFDTSVQQKESSLSFSCYMPILFVRHLKIDCTLVFCICSFADIMF